jgi:hypothetical protein
MSKTVSTDKARQGHWGRHLLTILVAALLLAAVAWGAAELYGIAIAPLHPAAPG